MKVTSSWMYGVPSVFRWWLRPRCEACIPAVIEENKYWRYASLGCDVKEHVYSFLESFRVAHPDKVMEVNPYRVEAQVLCPSQLTFNGFKVKGLLLPHLKLVDSSARNKITSHQPWFRIIPFPSPLTCPPLHHN